MRDTKRVLVLTDFQQRVLLNGWNEFRNQCIEKGLPTEDVDELLIKIHDAPTRREMRRSCREER